MTKLLRAAVVALLLAGLLPSIASAAPPATFERPATTSTFGTEVTWTQAFDSPVPLARVEVLLTFPQGIGPFVAEAAGATSAGSHKLTYTWSIATAGHIVPNTPITARWRLVPADRATAPFVGPAVTTVYADTRFQWQTMTGDLVRLHWYQGDDAFGKRALAIGDKAVADAAAFLGVTETEPIDFFVYADQAPFYDALGPGTRENVGGEAHSDIRTLFALIGPDEVNAAWVGIVIPHELTHVVFDTAVRNPYHFPPRWLNEGVAVYESEGYPASNRTAVEEAARSDRLMPLRALSGQFPTTAERFSLAYAESVSAIDFLVRTHGSDALVKLIRSYAGGVTDDEAFTVAVGVDLAGFEAAWLKDLGTKAPVQVGPQPAAPGPVPPGWDAAAPASSPAAPGAPSAAPAAPAAPVASPAPSATPATEGSGGAPGGEGWLLVAVALAGLAIGGSIAYVRRRRGRGGAAESSP